VFRYVRYFGSPLFLLLLALCSCAVGALRVTESYWLAYWVDAYANDAYVDVAFYAGTYAGLMAVARTMEGVEYLSYIRGAWIAAKRLHQGLLQGVLNAPLAWWKDMPVGRVVNRFARDVKSL